jgi:hypothetical protein
LREIRCLRKTDPSVTVLHSGACTVQDVEKIVGVKDVCKEAINTYKVETFCSSDNVTYNDAFAVLCSAKNSPRADSKTVLNILCIVDSVEHYLRFS